MKRRVKLCYVVLLLYVLLFNLRLPLFFNRSTRQVDFSSSREKNRKLGYLGINAKEIYKIKLLSNFLKRRKNLTFM